MAERSLFGVAELVDHCVGFVDSPRSLIACALVARSWADAAQSRLLRAPHVMNYSLSLGLDRSWLPLLDALCSSPHLIRHVRELELKRGYHMQALTQTTVKRICNLPFTDLNSVTLFMEESISGPEALELQQLFSLPSLRYVRLRTDITDPSTFAEIWIRCSASIQHLDLTASFANFAPAPPPSLRRNPTRLASLRLMFLGGRQCNQEELYFWALHPFDLSHLKALSAHHEGGVLWSAFAAAKIQYLDLDTAFSPKIADGALDLSMFPSLSFLRISPVDCRAPALLAAMSTVTASHHIGTIAIDLGSFVLRGLIRNGTGYGLLGMTECIQFDSTISTLPMSQMPTVEFEVDDKPGLKLFIGLTSRDGLRFIPRRHDPWWKRERSHVANAASNGLWNDI
ncbi:hypothetical protein B0H10DRAFT_1956074 [Mycena sp. CBHHK59/15]|nr:hypothetical protein B0H10DRAFT_1956074 [Mycena sp. CBHHK59/15]